MTSNQSTPGRYVLINSTVRSMIAFAYPLPSGQIVGGPEWISSDRYDVNATAGRVATRDEIAAMVRTLLTERFGFKAHIETRALPTYALMSTRDDGTIGPNMRHIDVDCAAAVAANTDAARSRTVAPIASNGAPVCGMLREAGGPLKAGGISMEMLAATLSRPAGRPVVDKTGLHGLYELTLTYSTEINAANDERPTLFTALREQLGLKLEAEDNQLEVLVIDGIERPTPD
jgi:uncharacterized protein (TIGR03435 family)